MPKKKPTRVEQHRWRISHLKGTPAKFLGCVDAGTESEALKKGIAEFKVKPDQRNRVIAHRDE
jgi:hypothetical protein